MDYKFVKTTCPFCGCGCQMLLEVLDGRLIGTLPFKGAQMNQGKLCIKGWNAHGFVQSPDRLTKPLIRKNGKLQEASWEETFDTVASRISDIKTRYGANSMSFLSSARCSNEENYLLQKLCRAGVGTNNVDHCARL
ncbi:Formate dehydrogenase subunit alpha (fragment) [uncultured Desulfobacterium sp.]|uniref:Formate dehydrogenase subunit alpha n=1 Tax=uncultured Desulfobacterium sp. TaxID=201089 RepID=A0A445N1D9_9BACT